MATVSPFLDPGSRTTPNTLAIVHLSRENLVPVILRDNIGEVDGYAEGTVINTRFGSFPHSTLIGQSWGSQIRASVVDTGSRGRKRKLAKLEEQEEVSNDTEEASSVIEQRKDLKTAASGFIHILPPTPELWTSSLPHRTQVVYTPDYSYILHRIRARPGMRIIEAGAGSGSFTHAAVRAVYNGHSQTSGDSRGKVFSFEFNEDRFHKMEQEIETHKLKEMVHITHRDVYNHGFLVDGQSPEADCIFLDLPAPWKALPHLSRSRPSQLLDASTAPGHRQEAPWISPLRSDRSVHLCTFSPCIEQVTKTVEAMRKLGWMEIEMVEVAQKRLNIMRERIGLNMPTERGTNLSPFDVNEAVQRLREVEGRFKEFHGRTSKASKAAGDDANDFIDDIHDEAKREDDEDIDMDEEDADRGEGEDQKAKSFMVGRLIHRTEPEIKTHTSYLVFAVMPQAWSQEQEEAAAARWPCGQENKVIGSLDKATRKQEKRELLKQKKKKTNGIPSGVDNKKVKVEVVLADNV